MEQLPDEAILSLSPTIFIKEQTQDLEADVLEVFLFSAKVFNFSGLIFYSYNLSDLRVYIQSDKEDLILFTFFFFFCKLQS